MTERRITVFYSALAAGIVAIMLVFLLDAELSSDIEQQQADLHENQIQACIRGGINRAEKFNNAVNEETHAIYMGAQENDPEIREGWEEKAQYEQRRQQEIMRESERIGYRLPNTVMNDCELVIGE